MTYEQAIKTLASATDYKEPPMVAYDYHTTSYPIGVDLYNQSVTVDLTKPLTDAATDSEHTICAMYKAMNWDGTQVTPTLTSNNAGGGQRMPDKDNFNCVLEPVAYGCDMGANRDMGDLFIDDCYYSGFKHEGRIVVPWNDIKRLICNLVEYD